MDPESSAYKLINECKCGFEELFILISNIDFDSDKEIDQFVKTLVSLCNEGYLKCDYHTETLNSVTEKQLKEHIQLRIDNGEDLESYPKSGKEFNFTATEKGKEQLSEKDRRIPSKALRG